MATYSNKPRKTDKNGKDNKRCGSHMFPEESIENGPVRKLSPLASRFPGNGEPPMSDYLRKGRPEQTGKRGKGMHYENHSD